MADLIDIHLRKFISEQISSVEQLEILLLLAEDASRAWSVEAVYQVIQSNRESVRNRLDAMRDAGFFEMDAAKDYRYKPGNNEIEKSVAALQAAYKESRVKVIEAIFSPVDQAPSFAEAFKIRRDK